MGPVKASANTKLRFMLPLTSMIMMGSAALCFGGSLFSRRPLMVLGASIMLSSMMDLAVFGSVAPVVWAGLLIFSGLLVGVDIRLSKPTNILQCGQEQGFSLTRGVMLAATLGYFAAGWLAITHFHTSGGSSSGASIGHSHAGGWLAKIMLLGVMGLSATLVIFLGLALRRRRGLLAIESGGMASMLIAMLIPTTT